MVLYLLVVGVRTVKPDKDILAEATTAQIFVYGSPSNGTRWRTEWRLKMIVEIFKCAIKIISKPGELPPVEVEVA
jgi:hypothetical protein